VERVNPERPNMKSLINPRTQNTSVPTSPYTARSTDGLISIIAVGKQPITCLIISSTSDYHRHSILFFSTFIYKDN
jgi:hypothetical protein